MICAGCGCVFCPDTGGRLEVSGPLRYCSKNCRRNRKNRQWRKTPGGQKNRAQKRWRYKSCNRKKLAFPDRETALARMSVINTSLAAHGEPLLRSVYECRWGPHFHLSHRFPAGEYPDLHDDLDDALAALAELYPPKYPQRVPEAAG